MKKILLSLCLLTINLALSGQQTVDYLLKARAYNSSGKPEMAIKVLSDAIAVSGENNLYLERAEARISQKAWSEAIADLNEANNLDPGSGEYGLSKIYAFKGDAATSLYHLESNLKSSFRKTEKEILLDPAFSFIENRPEWRQFWKKEWYSYTEKGISEIEYYLGSGKLDEARTLLDELRNKYMYNDDIIYAGSLINLSEGRYPEAIRAISGLLERNPGKEKYLRILAKAQTLSGSPAGASVTYTRLFSTGVADAELLLLRADCFRKTGEIDKALKDIDLYLELYPENKGALSLAGKVEALSGDNIKALDYFSRNIKLYPDDPQCYVDRANSYFVSGSWDRAIKDYSMSLDLNPVNPDVWLNKGIALLNSGKVEDACHDFREALGQGNKKATDYISRNCIRQD